MERQRPRDSNESSSAREKRERLRALLAERSSRRKSSSPDGETLPKITPDLEHRDEPFPLTDIQQAYWVGRKSAFALGGVSIHFYAELDSELDIERLELAWRQMVERHGMLRSTISPLGEQQILATVEPYEFIRHDLRHLDEGARARVLAEARGELSHQVFDLEKWPGFEIRVYRLTNGLRRILLSIDLVNADAGSVMILLREWMDAYDEPSRILEPLALSYRDYVLAELEFRKTERYERSVEWWKGRLADLPEAPQLPLATVPTQISKTRFEHRAYHLSPRDWRSLQERIRKAGLSDSVVLLAAYADILGAWSKSPQLTVNATLFNRLPFHKEVESILGDFTSMILLGVDTHSSPRFIDRARTVQKDLWEALEHRHVSGVRILRELSRLRDDDGAGMPVVYTSLLNLGSRNFASVYGTLGRIGKLVYSVTQTPQVWLDFQMHAENDGLTMSFDAVEGLFFPGFLDDMLGAYVRLLERLAQSDDAWNESSASPLPESQLEARAAVNATEAPLSVETLRSLFVARALENPDAIAVIAHDQTISYGEMLKRSNQIGNALVKRGARPDTLVGIMMEKGWRQIAAVLGVHAAGAAYLPIDPALPRTRKAHLIEHGEVQTVLTEGDADAELAGLGADLLRPDDPEIVNAAEGDPQIPVEPTHLSHVIYTSGSTGVPKGVMVEHGNVVNRILDINERLAVNAGDRAFALTSLSHDLSVYDVFGLLAAGGTIVVPASEHVKDPEYWLGRLRRDRVTLWNSVPAFSEMLIEYVEGSDEDGREPLTDLRAMILAGDWIPVSLPERVRALNSKLEFFASGGPTETTIWDIWNPVDSVDPSWRSIPYGKPLRNVRYHVLDEKLEDRPVWVPGEMYIGGACVTRGYWRDEERTRERFIEHPRTGERLYRSGDLGRYLPDGNLEFLGRCDSQVKIRGQRIELGEVESVLRSHPEVSEAVASVTGDGANRALVVYVIPNEAIQASRGGGSTKPKAAFAPEGSTIHDPNDRTAFMMQRLGLRGDRSSPSLSLPSASAGKTEQLARRRSVRSFSDRPVSSAQLGELLSWLDDEGGEGVPRHHYASAGNLYPVQVYVYVKGERVEGVADGAYYYHPVERQLVAVSDATAHGVHIHQAHNRSIFGESAFSVYMIGKMSAIEPLYGHLSRDFCLLESGYMSHLLMSMAEDCGLGLCPIGGVEPSALVEDLGLTSDHVFLHGLVGGVPKPKEDVGRSLPLPSSLPKRLREFAESQLPRPMVPSAVVVLDEFPLSRNGKVDRKRLPVPRDPVPTDSGEETSEPPAPGGELERRCSAIVCDVLGIEDIGIRDNFFRLGGNSIFIVKIHVRLKEEFQQEIPIVELFRNPTVEHLCRFLGSEDASAQSNELSAVELRARKRRQGVRRGRRRGKK